MGSFKTLKLNTGSVVELSKNKKLIIGVAGGIAVLGIALGAYVLFGSTPPPKPKPFPMAQPPAIQESSVAQFPASNAVTLPPPPNGVMPVAGAPIPVNGAPQNQASGQPIVPIINGAPPAPPPQANQNQIPPLPAQVAGLQIQVTELQAQVDDLRKLITAKTADAEKSAAGVAIAPSAKLKPKASPKTSPGGEAFTILGATSRSIVIALGNNDSKTIALGESLPNGAIFEGYDGQQIKTSKGFYLVH